MMMISRGDNFLQDRCKIFLGTSCHPILTRLKQLSYSSVKHRCLLAILDFCTVKTTTHHDLIHTAGEWAT